MPGFFLFAKPLFRRFRHAMARARLTAVIGKATRTSGSTNSIKDASE
jgi:hypothetical protein